MRTSNELSTLYKSIDQKNISDSAKETLKKIRLANKNFKGKDEDAQELFIDFFNKLKSSKPVAVKTTQEYKDAIKKAQIERGKKMREGKAKAKAPQGAGTEEDANRPAKPFGWRMRGKHNYRKPTRDDISKGKAYYEGRVNRADAKRKKYPMLERGGMAEGGEIRSQKEFNELVEEKEKIVKNLSPKEVAEMWNRNTIGSPTKMTEEEGKMSNSKMYLADLLVEKELSEAEYNQYFEKGGYMARGGYVSKGELVWRKLTRSERMDFLNKNFTPQITPRSQETLVGKDYNFLPKNVKIVMESKYANVEDYAKGGAIENQYEGRTPKDIWDNLSKPQRSHFILDHAEQIEGYMEREFASGQIREAMYSDFKMLDPWIKHIFEHHVRVGQYAKGGYMENGGEVGKSFTILQMNEKLNRMFPDSFGFSVGTFSEEGNKTRNSSALIANENDPFRGLKDSDIDSKLFFPQYKRVHDIRFRIYQGGENTYFHFNLESEKGDEYIGQFGFKDQGNVPSSYITRFIAFLMEQYGLPFEVNHSVMAKGGTIDEMAVYVSARDIEEIKLTINGDKKTLKGSDLMDGVYVKKASLKAKFDAYEVYNKLSDMSYNVWDKLKIESGSQIENSDSLQKKLQVEYEKAGIDSLFKSLTKAQRKKVAEILTDENQHSLRNYLALRGYEGEMEYNSYKDGYDNQPKGRKYYLSPYVITRVVTMEEGGEVFYTEKHKND
jgi:hypothetical protein